VLAEPSEQQPERQRDRDRLRAEGDGGGDVEPRRVLHPALPCRRRRQRRALHRESVDHRADAALIEHDEGQ
jgi:hypothetical protein